MSNPYPPTPSFGGAYTGHPFAVGASTTRTTATGSRDGGSQTLSGGPPAFQQREMYPTTTPINIHHPAHPPAANRQSFQANSTISNTGHTAVPPSLPPPPFHVSPAFFKQFANSTLPPPPYPPVPIPHLGFPQFPPPLPNLVATSTPPQNSVTNSSLPQHNSQPHLLGPHNAPEYMPNSYIVSKEEGELSDGESDTNSPNSMVGPGPLSKVDHTPTLMKPRELATLNTKGDYRVQPPNPPANTITAGSKNSVIGHPSSTSRAVFSKAENMGNVFPRPSEIQEDRILSPDNDSVSSYNPPSASTPDPGESSGDMADTPLNGFQFAHPPVSTQVNQPASAILLLRDQVKDALRSLEAYNIEYNDLVGEGVDRHLLRKLYEDLKQEVVQSTPPSLEMNAKRVPAAQKSIQQDPLQSNNFIVRSSHDPGQTMQAANTVDTKSVLAPDRSASKSIEGKRLSDVSKAPTPIEVRIEKPSVLPPPSNAAMERKDRIAQLLAAKTGKAITPRLPSETTPQLPVKAAKPQPLVEAPKKPLSLPEKPPAPSPEQSVKVKNKAQTDLIRQKMEALKKEALAKAQAQDSAKVVSIASSPASEPPSSAPHVEQTVSAIATKSNEFAFQIPGLFMAIEARPNQSAVETGRTEHSPLQKLNNSISLSSTPDNISQRSSAERYNEALHSPNGKTLPMRMPKKRPLASDSFDEQMPAVKRPFGRKDSHGKVEIVLSEAESEGEVEDVEMELDEDSDEETQNHQNGPPIVSLPQSNIRKLQSPTDLPSSKPVTTFASSVATPTSSAVQTPGREKDKEELWKAKHQEIELMRKKIAEMEERRKAKQIATHVISPKAAGKPGLPAIRTSLTRLPNSEIPVLAKPVLDVKASAPSDGLKSPGLPASQPEDLPSTPSTPLYAIKEPLKAEDLRQKLLRRKTTREGTPVGAEMEARQAQLAEKKAKLAELRQEAEKREAEILEETRMLEAQLQAGLDEHETYEDDPYTENGHAEMVTSSTEQKPLDGSLSAKEGMQGGATKQTSAPMQMLASVGPQGSPLESCSQGSSSQADVVPYLPTGKDTLDEGSGDVHTINFTVPDLNATSQGSQDLSLGSTDQVVDLAVVRPPEDSTSMPMPETDQINVRSISSIYEDEVVDEAPPLTIETDFIDEDGSVSMSDSVSEDYEPAEPAQIGEDQAEDDSESYHPAQLPVTVDEAHQTATKQDKIDEAIEVGTSFLEAPSQLLGQDDHEFEEPTYVDDFEDGMQLTEPDVINQPQLVSQSHVDESSDNNPQSISYFTPYETPRKYFKNFRYHDRFPETVPSGYKSLTFSNNIDPRRPFCPTELAGQACQDPTCEEQHFRQVALTDDKILAQMSTANNLKSKADHERWVAGLRQVIADLRSKGVKDFHMVATALAAYRRRFSEELSTSTSASSQS